MRASVSIGTGTTLKCGPGPGSGGPEGGGSSCCWSSGPAESPPHARSARARRVARRKGACRGVMCVGMPWRTAQPRSVSGSGRSTLAFADDLRESAKRLVHGGGVGEDGRHVRVQADDVDALGVAVRVLAANARPELLGREVVLLAELVSLSLLAHKPCARAVS